MTLTVGGRITVWLASRLTGLDSTKQQNTLLFGCTETSQAKPVVPALLLAYIQCNGLLAAVDVRINVQTVQINAQPIYNRCPKCLLS